jgi:hypothetical protein
MIEDYLNNDEYHCEEVHNTLITVILYNYKKEVLLGELYKQLENIKNITHSKTKKTLNDRIYNFIKYIELLPEDQELNNIYFINDKLNSYSLKKKEVALLKEYNIKNLNIYCEQRFKIEYLSDFFTNFDFNDIIVCNKNNIKHIRMTISKQKVIMNSCCKDGEELSNIINNITGKYKLVHGCSTLLKKFQCNNVPIYNKSLANKEILDIIHKIKLKENHQKLKIIFDYLDDERKLHLLIYGKIKNEIKSAIEEYRIKELYCHKDRIYLVKKQLPKEYYNFPIIIVETIDEGDVAHRLLRDYKGVIGLAYY